MSNNEARKISIDDVVESAASGVLRALDARAAAAGGVREVDTNSLVKAGFSVDFLIRCGGPFGPPIDILGRGSPGQPGR